MKNSNLDDLTDDELYASYEAYKALMDAGLSKDQALSRTGLTPQIVKDFEEEDDEMDFKSEFKEVWDEDGDYDEEDWSESDDDVDDWSGSEEDFDDYEDSTSYDEKY